jgi:hypothetical protein
MKTYISKSSIKTGVIFDGTLDEANRLLALINDDKVLIKPLASTNLYKILLKGNDGSKYNTLYPGDLLHKIEYYNEDIDWGATQADDLIEYSIESDK